MQFDPILQRQFTHYQQESLLRQQIPLTRGKDKNRVMIDGRSCLLFCSNDYLGLSAHPIIKRAFVEAADQYGFGSGASALVSGYFSVQQELEAAFSAFLNRDKSIFFNSGYAANLGALTALCNRHATIISDRAAHASLLDGIRLSRAQHYRFRHNDVADLERLLKITQQAHQKSTWVVTEGVFSMGGDLAPLKTIAEISQRYQARLIVDDAHGIGVLGKNGGGACEYWGLTQKEVPCLVLPLGKAFGGMGAIISGRADWIEAILQFAPSYRCTTALPPAICAAMKAVLAVIQSEPVRREILHQRILFFVKEAQQRGLPLLWHEPTPIQSIIIGDNHRVQKLQENMINAGFFVASIRPPTVSQGMTQIRISLNTDHTEPEIETLLDYLHLFLKEG